MRTLALLILLFVAGNLHGQLYVETGSGTASFDLCTCEQSAIFDPLTTSSIAAGPDGNPYYLSGNDIIMFNVATGIPTLLDTLPDDGSSVSMVYGPNNTIYMAGLGYGGAQGEVLWSYNTVTGVLTNLGEMPPDFFLQGDLFFFNGQLYGLMATAINGESVVVQIPLNNPAGATIVQNFPNLVGMVGGISVIYNGVETVFALATDLSGSTYGLYQLNISTGTYELFCPGVGGGDLGAPLNYVVPPCCQNFAGNFQNLNLETSCQSQSITLTHLGDEVLVSGSALSYVLVADSTSILPGGILQISANPTFNFNAATMNLNQTYFVAAVAAPGPAGVPNWSDPCRDVSYFAAVQWMPAPTVTFSVAQNQTCAGECQNIEVNFTGTPPFNLVYNTPAGQQTVDFATNSGPLEICPPAGFLGIFSIQAVRLTDVYCVCE